MKKVASLFVLFLAGALLSGCQSAEETIHAQEPPQKTELFLSETLIETAEISKLEVTKKKGVNPIIYDEAADLASFDNLFSSAVKEPGIVNMSDPTFYLEVSDVEGNKQYLQLWIGGEGERASLMREDDSHTVYSLSAEMTKKLAELQKKEA